MAERRLVLPQPEEEEKDLLRKMNEDYLQKIRELRREKIGGGLYSLGTGISTGQPKFLDQPMTRKETLGMQMASAELMATLQKMEDERKETIAMTNRREMAHYATVHGNLVSIAIEEMKASGRIKEEKIKGFTERQKLIGKEYFSNRESNEAYTHNSNLERKEATFEATITGLGDKYFTPKGGLYSRTPGDGLTIEWNREMQQHLASMGDLERARFLDTFESVLAGTDGWALAGLATSGPKAEEAAKRTSSTDRWQRSPEDWLEDRNQSVKTAKARKAKAIAFDERIAKDWKSDSDKLRFEFGAGYRNEFLEEAAKIQDLIIAGTETGPSLRPPPPKEASSEEKQRYLQGLYGEEISLSDDGTISATGGVSDLNGMQYQDFTQGFIAGVGGEEVFSQETYGTEEAKDWIEDIWTELERGDNPDLRKEMMNDPGVKQWISESPWSETPDLAFRKLAGMARRSRGYFRRQARKGRRQDWADEALADPLSPQPKRFAAEVVKRLGPDKDPLLGREGGRLAARRAASAALTQGATTPGEAPIAGQAVSTERDPEATATPIPDLQAPTPITAEMIGNAKSAKVKIGTILKDDSESLVYKGFGNAIWQIGRDDEGKATGKVSLLGVKNGVITTEKTWESVESFPGDNINTEMAALVPEAVAAPPAAPTPEVVDQVAPEAAPAPPPRVTEPRLTDEALEEELGPQIYRDPTAKGDWTKEMPIETEEDRFDLEAANLAAAEAARKASYEDPEVARRRRETEHLYEDLRDPSSTVIPGEERWEEAGQPDLGTEEREAEAQLMAEERERATAAAPLRHTAGEIAALEDLISLAASANLIPTDRAAKALPILIREEKTPKEFAESLLDRARTKEIEIPLGQRERIQRYIDESIEPVIPGEIAGAPEEVLLPKSFGEEGPPPEGEIEEPPPKIGEESRREGRRARREERDATKLARKKEEAEARAIAMETNTKKMQESVERERIEMEKASKITNLKKEKKKETKKKKKKRLRRKVKEEGQAPVGDYPTV